MDRESKISEKATESRRWWEPMWV